MYQFADGVFETVDELVAALDNRFEQERNEKIQAFLNISRAPWEQGV